MAITFRHFIAHCLQDCIPSGLFGIGCSAATAALSEESFRPMVAGNIVCTVFSSHIGNATFEAATRIINATGIENPTIKKAILVFAAIFALLATLGVGTLISGRLEASRGEDFATSFEVGMTGSLLAMIFLMKDRYNQAAHRVGLHRHHAHGRSHQEHGHGHGPASAASSLA